MPSLPERATLRPRQQLKKVTDPKNKCIREAACRTSADSGADDGPPSYTSASRRVALQDCCAHNEIRSGRPTTSLLGAVIARRSVLMRGTSSEFGAGNPQETGRRAWGLSEPMSRAPRSVAASHVAIGAHLRAGGDPTVPSSAVYLPTLAYVKGGNSRRVIAPSSTNASR